MRADESIEALIAGRAGITYFKAGDVLYRPDDESCAFWLLRSGRVEVTRQPRVVPHAPIVVIAEPGWVVGAMGVMLGGARTGTATVIEPTTATIIQADRLAELLDRAPGLRALVREFASRWDRRHLPART
jgi:CRP-like cAMP-binding protein